ncbi:MAG: MBOAT family protein [Saprospiraceae bacterium]|nr:MBOAT family protein [Saprospiraceae bacterium]
MLFNSLIFFLFLPLVFALYWSVFSGKLKGQNSFLLLASYLFYGWWDYRFLTLILFSTVVDFVIGIRLEKTAASSKKKLLLGTSIIVNLGLLAVFKYFNFFLESWVDAWAFFGIEISVASLKLILPVGISFYTFQTLSYSIDVYRGKLIPTKSFINFAAFVSFFPQLVAGPIERAANLLPQIERPRSFSYQQGLEGLRLILWGMFKKVVIADFLAPVVDDIFSNYDTYPGSVLVLGAIYFAFQIYCDFSGYSDIAIGVAKLFGVELMSNFKFPYFSRDIAEFWRRWHISLSTWFRDYLYIPLGGSRVGRAKVVRNVFIIFLVSGFWHGANWTFICWGGIHALLFLPLLLLDRNRKHGQAIIAEDRLFPSFRECLAMLGTFAVVTFAWIFFRADSVSVALDYLAHIPKGFLQFPAGYSAGLYYILALLLLEWIIRKDERNIRLSANVAIRYIFYTIQLLMILANFSSAESFIYFQF